MKYGISDGYLYTIVIVSAIKKYWHCLNITTIFWAFLIYYTKYHHHYIFNLCEYTTQGCITIMPSCPY